MWWKGTSCGYLQLPSPSNISLIPQLVNRAIRYDYEIDVETFSFRAEHQCQAFFLPRGRYCSHKVKNFSAVPTISAELAYLSVRWNRFRRNARKKSLLQHFWCSKLKTPQRFKREHMWANMAHILKSACSKNGSSFNKDNTKNCSSAAKVKSLFISLPSILSKQPESVFNQVHFSGSSMLLLNCRLSLSPRLQIPFTFFSHLTQVIVTEIPWCTHNTYFPSGTLQK